MIVIDMVVGNVFVWVLVDVGVFKWDDVGEVVFDCFVVVMYD